jgi:integrase
LGKVLVPPRRAIEQSEIQDMLMKAKRHRDRALIVLLYLIGPRISEALSLRRKDFVIDNERQELRIVLPILKRSKKKFTPFVAEHTITLSFKTPFIETLLAWVQKFQPDDLVFNITRIRAWQIIKELNPSLYLHFFRHSRLTKLAEAGGTPFELMSWAGWSSPRPAVRYVSGTSRMIEKFKEKIE